MYEAFFLLTDSRPVHFGGLGAIPLSEIESYMRVDGIEEWDDRYRFMLLIKRMDAEYLKLQAARQEQRDKTSKQRQQVGGSTLRPRGRMTKR